ncbi:MAG: hypothetical protein IPI67_02610 [Myxococcales bacterium]|nr:hypothetical protein [Myxococcales bacterium]
MSLRRVNLDAMRLGTGVAIAVFLVSATNPARADEPRKVTEPSVLREPAEVTQVVDAFDEDDPFDLHLSLGFQQTWKSAKIRRESAVSQPGLTTGGFTSDDMNVAGYSETTSRLNTRAAIGVYKDIQLVFRLPIILSNKRKLEGLEGSDKVQPVVLAGAPGEQLFSLPFESPTRSGIEYLAVGMDFGLMNQFRDLTKPTWVIGFEGRFSVSEPMHACSNSTAGLNQPGPQKKCAHPSDINRNGLKDVIDPATGDPLEGENLGEREPGVSRGTTGLELHTFLSKRIKYIEPYGGFRALFEFQNDSSDYGSTDLKGSLVNHPPLAGSLIMGLNVIPWEIRDQYQRVTIDFRFTGTYRSEGRDYSELFDAIGSSDAPSVRAPAYASYRENPAFDATQPDGPNNPRSVVDPNSQKVYTTGLTDVQQHGTYMFSTEVTWQAGEYVKFTLGGGYTLVQSHLITFDQACNPDFSDDVTKSGPCKNTTASGYSATGIPNPNYRPVINTPGRRFKVDDSHAFDAWLNATVMF